MFYHEENIKIKKGEVILKLNNSISYKDERSNEVLSMGI